MARNCRYAEQLSESCRLVCEAVSIPQSRYGLAYQSRSGRPGDPWLESDVCDYLSELKSRGVRDVVVLPIGFLSDHVEVLYDLDVEAQDKSRELGLTMVRAATVGIHPAFVGMLADLIEERLSDRPREAVGKDGSEPRRVSGGLLPADLVVRPPWNAAVQPAWIVGENHIPKPASLDQTFTHQEKPHRNLPV